MAEQDGKSGNIPELGTENSMASASNADVSGTQVSDVKNSEVQASEVQDSEIQALGKHLFSKGKEGKLPIVSLLLSFLMALAILFYVLLSTTDVLYSDYIRLVNSYLGKPFQIGDLLQKDILTRIPLTYFFREINRHFFGYTLIFDRVLGVLGLFLAS